MRNLFFFAEVLFANLAVEVLIREQELDEADHDGVLKLPFAYHVNGGLDQVTDGKLLAHPGSCEEDAVPQGPEHQQEDDDLNRSEQCEPVDSKDKRRQEEENEVIVARRL